MHYNRVVNPHSLKLLRTDRGDGMIDDVVTLVTSFLMAYDI